MQPYTADFVPDAQFAATHCTMTKDKQHVALWRIRWKFMTTDTSARHPCTSILPKPRAVWPIMRNITSSTKQQTHYILHYRQKNTEPRPHGNRCRKCLVKFGHVFWDVWANRQTDRQTRWSQYFTPLSGRERSTLCLKKKRQWRSTL